MYIEDIEECSSERSNCDSSQSLAFSDLSDLKSLNEHESLRVATENLSISVAASSTPYETPTFTCQICFLSLPDLVDHIKETLHSIIVYDPLKAIVECEDCGNSSVDLLYLIHEVGEEISAMCVLCEYCVLPMKDNIQNVEILSAGGFEQLTEYFESKSKVCLGFEEKSNSIEFGENNPSSVCSKCNAKIKHSLYASVVGGKTNKLFCQSCTSTSNTSSLVADRKSFFENEISRNLSVLGSEDSQNVPSLSGSSEELYGTYKNSEEPIKRRGSLVTLVEVPSPTANELTFDSTPLPRLTYDTMDEYCNAMCAKLFLEEELNIPEDRRLVLKYSDFDLEWSDDYNRKSDYFTISIPWNNKISRRFLSKKMEKMGKSPFFKGQGMILMLGDNVPLYCGVTSAEFEKAQDAKTKKWSTKFPKVLIVSIKRYSWNANPLPTTQRLHRLEILPVSVPTSRLFSAMSQLSNPEFVELILGKTKIRKGNSAIYNCDLEAEALNGSQKSAIETVLSDSITVIQGPPGTGKTWTIYKLISQLLLTRDLPILVVAASNLAVDNIVEKLIPEHGNCIVRVVAVSKEAEYMDDTRVGPVCLHNKVYKGMEVDIQSLIDKLRNPQCFLSESEFKRVMNAQIEYSNRIMRQSKVILTTSVSAGGIQLQKLGGFPVVIMDEATQSSDVTSLIPLALPEVKKFVFVGDQKQLSSFSPIAGLSFSLFERVLANGTYGNPIMLDTQYRMHPAISEFPKNQFYGGLLKDGITLNDRQSCGIPSEPLVFWDTGSYCSEEVVGSRFWGDYGRTYCNPGEVGFIEKVLEHFIQVMHVERSHIGVITPYSGQRDLISKTLETNMLINPSGKELAVETNRDEFDESKTVTIHSVSDIMIASIDAFQGREKDFMVMSCVRSNDLNNIGFLKDKRRLNVALTRAKYALVVIGNLYCLKNGGDLWRDYIEYLEKRGSVLKNSHFRFH